MAHGLERQGQIMYQGNTDIEGDTGGEDLVDFQEGSFVLHALQLKYKLTR